MAEYKKSIENFKAALAGGGVRPSMFQVELRFPNSVVDSTAGVDEQGIFMIQASFMVIKAFKQYQIDRLRY